MHLQTSLLVLESRPFTNMDDAFERFVSEKTSGRVNARRRQSLVMGVEISRRKAELFSSSPAVNDGTVHRDRASQHALGAQQVSPLDHPPNAGTRNGFFFEKKR